MAKTEEQGQRGLIGKRRNIVIVALLLVTGLAGALYYRGQQPSETPSGSPPQRGMGGGRPQPVSVTEVRQADVPIWVAALGTATPRNQVTVRSRVDGELVKLHFREGEQVKRGQPLADIDPRPFQVQLMQANGQLAKDTALLKNAEIDLERYKDLWAKDSIAKQQLDTQEALVRQIRGTVEADRGQVENARLQLTYAHIVAPVSGRIGLRQVDPGNQVRAGDANGLAVIAQLQPITVVFAIPESFLPAVNKRLSSGEAVTVDGWDRELKNRLASGKLITIDNLVDTATGTIKAKAEFANDDNALFPNQFVNVRLLLGTRKEALVVPGAAILRGAKGSFVYAVNGEGVVSSIPVTPGPADGDLVAVDGKLTPGTRIVTDGADKLRDGAKVEIIAPEARAAVAAAGEQKQGMRGKRRGDGEAPPEGGWRKSGNPEGGEGERPRRPEGGKPPAAN